MKTLICPTCGCSLVRLGISKEKSVTNHSNGQEYHCPTGEMMMPHDAWEGSVSRAAACPGTGGRYRRRL